MILLVNNACMRVCGPEPSMNQHKSRNSLETMRIESIEAIRSLHFLFVRACVCSTLCTMVLTQVTTLYMCSATQEAKELPAIKVV